MSTKIKKILQSVFKDEVPKSKEKSGEDAENGVEDTQTPLLSGIEKIIYAAKHWDPFPLRGHDVDDVNEVNKHVLLAIISFLLCTSFALIWISVFIIDARRSHDYAPTDSFSSHILSFSAIILVISLLSFVFTLCGFVGVFRENIILIRIFYIALIVLLSLKLSIALFTFSFTGTAEYMVGSVLGDKLILNYRASTDIEATMDYLQVKFRCCGLREQGFKDWTRSIYFNCSDENPSTERCGVPWSCCRNETGFNNALCGRNVQKVDRNLASRTIYTKGCIIAILQWAKNHAFLVAFLLLLETLLLTVLIFQCTHLVNELQMISGVYRGPWWIWIGESRLDGRPQFPQGAECRDKRPMEALPFHLELMWHETPAAADRWSPAADRWSPAADQRETPTTEPAASARHQQRRSTAGQRFFRAVLSRASRVANRRQAVSAEEERRRGPAVHGQDQPGSGGDWVVHQRARDAGSVGPSDAACHALEPVGEEGEMEPDEANMPQQSPLPPVGERDSVPSTSPEVQETAVVEPVQQTAQSQDQRELLVSPGGTSPATAAKQTQGLSDLETTKPLMPGLIASQNQMNLPSIHSEQGSSKHLLEIVPKFSEEKTSNTVSPSQNPREGVARSEQPSSNELTASASPGSAPALEKSDFKSPASSRIALVLDAVENHEGSAAVPPSPPASADPDDEARAPPGGAERAPAPQVSGPAPAAAAARQPAAAAHQPAAAAQQPAAAAPTELVSPAAGVAQRRPSESVTPAVPSGSVDRPPETMAPSAADVSPYRTVSTAKPGVGDDGAAHQGAVENGNHQASHLPNGESPAGREDGAMAGQAPDQQQQREVSDASTDTHSDNRGTKHHRRKSKPHKKRKKKGHVAPAEEAVSTGDPGAENEPVHEWLRPNTPKIPDESVTNEVKGSAYFSPSEFEHLAVRQSPSPAGKAEDSRTQRKGSVARAISMKLHEIMPSLSPAPAAQPQRQTADDDHEHISVTRAVSRKLRDIFGFHSGGSSEPKASTSRTPTRPLPPESVGGTQGVILRPNTWRGPETPEPVSPAASPLPLPEAESHTDHEL